MTLREKLEEMYISNYTLEKVSTWVLTGITIVIMLFQFNKHFCLFEPLED